tara:strand:+ start:665 stop:1123 length:459 start_codon:yes stop_codon:yes gene_type:complete
MSLESSIRKSEEPWHIDSDININIEDKKNIVWNFEDGWNSIYDNNKLLKGQLHDYQNKYKLELPYKRSATIQWTGEVKNMSFSLKYKSLFDNYFEFEFRIDKEGKICELSKTYDIINLFDRIPSEFELPNFKVKTVREAMIYCLLYCYHINI